MGIKINMLDILISQSVIVKIKLVNYVLYIIKQTWRFLMNHSNTLSKSFLYSIIIIVLGSISSFLVPIFSNMSIKDIYSSLSLPAISPPNWIFGPVWIILYILLGIYLANSNKHNVKLNWLMYIQLILNFIWTPIFFGTGNYLLASIIIVLMDVFTLIIFYKDRSNHKYLLLPYIVWILFATYLTISVFIMN